MKISAALLGQKTEAKSITFFVQRQFWIFNYYIKSLPNISNENRKAGVSREILLQK